MSPALLFTFVIAYFALLLFVAWRTSKGSNNESFFIGNRNSNWMLVAFGMIGTSLSGVTFVSVPGAVARESFAYFQITIGYFLGYILIAFILLPLYYRLQLTSIYNYLDNRLGRNAYKTGAGFFILSRVLGATARLYLVVNILQDAILSSFHVPFWLTTLIILLMILLYTYEGGVKTIVWTDTLQTTCMLGGLVVCVIYILHHLNLSLPAAMDAMHAKGYSKIFFTDPSDKLFFVKQILAGMFITVTMTGMDQEMMQKSISVRTLKDSQKNMVVLGFIMLFVIFLFLFLGGLLHLFGSAQGLDLTGDKLFPELALHHMPKFISIIFIIALISALFPSSDGAITALTASTCIDMLGIQRNVSLTEDRRKRIRQRIHLVYIVVFLLFVLVYKWISSDSMIGIILKVAAYTYGPLLGLFSFSILTKKQVRDSAVPFVCVLSPVICFLLDSYQDSLFAGKFHIGLELLLINGLITFVGLLLIAKPPIETKS
ncbi:MAG TPA: sodium:solute symporter [Puia sp.]|nr:sodium:solute symporter [Puia sp.]